MNHSHTNLSLEAILVLGSSSKPPEPPIGDPLSPGASENISRAIRMSVSVSGLSEAPRHASAILGKSFSHVSEMWKAQLSEGYKELGEALGKMAELEEADEWSIEQSVYEVASNVATQLMASDRPAPRLFTHGSKSVVFNWSQESEDLYLTISEDTLSALVSTPEKIRQRIDCPITALLNPALLLGPLESATLRQSAAFISVSSSTSLKPVD